MREFLRPAPDDPVKKEEEEEDWRSGLGFEAFACVFGLSINLAERIPFFWFCFKSVVDDLFVCVCVCFLVLLGIIISQPNGSETSAHQCGLLCKTLRTRNVRRKLLMRKPKEKPCFYLLSVESLLHFHKSWVGFWMCLCFYLVFTLGQCAKSFLSVYCMCDLL